MISFETWLPQILGYCEFVCDDVALVGAWVNRDTSATSVTTFEELYEQIFDDLDSDLLQAELSVLLKDKEELQRAIRYFLEALRAFDHVRTTHPELNDAGAFLSSKSWQDVRLAARAALAVQAR